MSKRLPNASAHRDGEFQLVLIRRCLTKAITRTRYGSADVLELRDIDVPVPKDNEVLVRVCAASVNPLDWHFMRGDPFLMRLMGFGILKPKQQTFGADMAGRVEAIGKSVTQFKVGDEVFGSGVGAFAEYGCLRESRATHKPEELTFERAATVPVAGITALQALRDHGKLQAGQHVLINGASGGVGTFAVQIAKAMGARVTGVCSGRNVEMVRSIGADEVIDYTKEDYWLREEKYDLIVDTAAFYSISKPLSALKRSGICVVVGGGSMSSGSIMLGSISNPIMAGLKRRKLVTLMASIKGSDLAFVAELLAIRKIVPVIDRKYPLSETAEAIRYVETGHARGKVVISVER
jgi:NADPH:quinone reductase-like Zn-dependent oxidoreductase